MDEDAIRDIFAALGPVAVRRMFGGKGIYYNDVIIAVEVRGELMLKADSVSVPDFTAAGSTQWTYSGAKNGKLVSMPYWTVPETAIDDPEELALWARKAYEAGLRTGAKSGLD
jgi:DNA transformation protein